MIVTVTANPSLDLTYRVEALGDAEVHRATSATLEASGKGVNVSRALHSAGVATVAVLPVAGATGEQLLHLLDGEGVASAAVTADGATRLNTTVLHPGGTLKVNAPGTALPGATVEALLTRTDRILAESVDATEGETWLVVSGSLPPGAPPDLLSAFVSMARARGASVAVDTSGPPLADALAARPHLASPNLAELAEVDARVADMRDGAVPLPEIAAAYAARTGTTLLVSAGADGAVWTDGATTVRAVPAPVTPVNTAGSGDALLAGWLAGAGEPQERLARAVAWGTATCLSPTTVRPDVDSAAGRLRVATEPPSTKARAASALT